jgi:hypothetical protein
MSVSFQDYLKVCALAISLLVFGGQSKASTYYIDYVSGNDRHGHEHGLAALSGRSNGNW